VDASLFANVHATVARFIRERVIPRESEIEDSDAIPDDLRHATAELGLFGYALPEQFGGLGASLAQDVELALEFGYTVPAFRSLFGTNNGIAGQMLAKFGSEGQKAEFLPRMASGNMIAAFALTEAEAGSNPGGLRTKATPIDGGWSLSGSKRFITNAPLAQVFVVFARTPGDTRGTDISAFLVDANSAGLDVGPHDPKMGQRGAWTAEVNLSDVRVSESRLIGKPGDGYRNAMSVLARGRVHIAAMCVGTAQRVLDESVRYVSSSKSGDQLIGSFQLVQGMIAESYAEIQAGRSLVRDAARAYDEGRDMSLGPSAAKLFCSEMVSRVADRGVQVHGGMGYMKSTVVERAFRDSRLYRIYEGTSEIQKVIIARELQKSAGS
jgi:acyl-CoA dehydrogenase